MRFRSVMLGSLVVGLLAAATPAQAALITGQLVVSGNFVYDNLVLTTSNPGDAGLDFEASAALPPPPDTPTELSVIIDGGTGYFTAVGVVLGTTAQIANITNVNPPTSPNYAFLPDGVDLTATPFLNFLSSFSAEVGLSYNVTQFIDQGSTCPATPTCAEGPFLLTQSATGFDITFDFLGYFYNTKGTLTTADDDSGLYSAHFVTSIAGLTFDELQGRLIGTGPLASQFGQDIGCGNTAPHNNDTNETCGFTATFSPITPAAVPEPATLVTFGLGSLALAAVRRRKAKK